MVSPEQNGTFETEIQLDLGDTRTQRTRGWSQEQPAPRKLLEQEHSDALRASAN